MLLRRTVVAATLGAVIALTAAACQPIVLPTDPQGSTTTTTTAPPPAGYWKPAVGTTWNYDLSQPAAATTDVSVVDIDTDNPQSVIDSLHAAGKKVICYFDAGSIENYRADFKEFPKQALSSANAEWPDERWLDIRHLDDFTGPTGKTARQLTTARMDACKAKGFDALDPDMMEAYDDASVRYPTGGRPTRDDQLAFNRWVASYGHSIGLAVGLKGAVGLIPDLVGDFDFTVNEQCFQYKECDAVAAFARAGKAVLHVEYSTNPTKYCPVLKPQGFSSLKKAKALRTPYTACP